MHTTIKSRVYKKGGGILLRCSSINEAEFQAFFPLSKATL